MGPSYQGLLHRPCRFFVAGLSRSLRRPGAHLHQFVPPSGAIVPIQDGGAQFRCNLLDALTRAIRDSKGGLARSTQKKLSGDLLKWRKFLASVGIRDFWIDGVPQQVRPLLVGRFLAALRRNQFGKKVQQKLLYSTLKGALSAVRTEFRQNMKPDPAVDGSGNMSVFIQRQLRGYEDVDPP